MGGSISFMQAIKDNSVDQVKTLIHEKSDVNKPDEHGITPVMLAITSHRYTILETLIEAKANIDFKDPTEGTTLLMYASSIGDRQLVRLLVDAGVDVHDRDNAGWTALMYASQHGDPNIIRTLIKGGANTDSQDFVNGATPLMIAASQGNDYAVEILLESGASPKIKDKYGYRAIDQCKTKQCADLLKHYKSRNTVLKEHRVLFALTFDEWLKKTQSSMERDVSIKTLMTMLITDVIKLDTPQQKKKFWLLTSSRCHQDLMKENPLISAYDKKEVIEWIYDRCFAKDPNKARDFVIDLALLM